MLSGWDEGPFYYDNGDPEDSLNHWIDEDTIQFLQIGPELVADLMAWDDEFQQTFNRDDFRASGFPSEEAEKNWVQKGKELAVRLKQESPVVARVDYQAYGCIPKGSCMI
ncbi:hypothetical protein [Actinoalloteichus hymeniacidonis]|uniref:Uncharacterized protein n=1 Tax=Actinoalloteichus hymeniacidonis TaxID=340345 RepID=A0AAC9HLY7_9PSEU|nr:hypothetical protein [Actinoalloteichus hymeniacidonis]AOS61548.1 hypothetical protein TL08_03580 [Actinoalloteichus hymeniacidonis]MBB5910444.1 hypothetical protein [Actinoalloteichus hymeniacidonis]